MSAFTPKLTNRDFFYFFDVLLDVTACSALCKVIRFFIITLTIKIGIKRINLYYDFIHLDRLKPCFRYTKVPPSSALVSKICPRSKIRTQTARTRVNHPILNFDKQLHAS